MKQFRGVRALDGVDIEVGERRDRGPDRAERQRQDDAPQRGQRRAAADGRARRRRRADATGRPAARVRAARRRAHVPADPPVRRHDRARERRGRRGGRGTSARDGSAALLERIGARGGSPSAWRRRSPYGLQRRVEIARALAGGPRFLLLDEPAAGMNETESDDLLETIQVVRDERGLGVLIVDHDLRLIMRLCERIHVLAEGRTICEGSPRGRAQRPRRDRGLPRQGGGERRAAAGADEAHEPKERGGEPQCRGKKTGLRPWRGAIAIALRGGQRAATPAASRASATELKIGFSGALSGAYAAYDVPLLNGMEFAAKEINAEGGSAAHGQDRLQGQQGRPDPDARRRPRSCSTTGIKVFVLTTADTVGRAAASSPSQGGGIASVGGNTAPRGRQETSASAAFLFVFGDNVQASAGAEYACEQGYKKALHDRLARDPVHEGHARATSRTPSSSCGGARSRARTLQDRPDRVPHAGHEDPERRPDARRDLHADVRAGLGRVPEALRSAPA